MVDIDTIDEALSRVKEIDEEQEEKMIECIFLDDKISEMTEKSLDTSTNMFEIMDGIKKLVRKKEELGCPETLDYSEDNFRGIGKDNPRRIRKKRW
jgi:hypothetical protein